MFVLQNGVGGGGQSKDQDLLHGSGDFHDSIGSGGGGGGGSNGLISLGPSVRMMEMHENAGYEGELPLVKKISSEVP